MNASNKVGSGGVDAMLLSVDVGSLTAFDPKGDLNGISNDGSDGNDLLHRT